MKGMELSLHVIVILALAIIVLVSVLFFVFSQSGEQISKTEANRIFQEKCSLYRSLNCDWGVTHREDFDEFLKACQLLYGRQNLAFSCLGKYCCNKVTDAKCDGLCELCKANKKAGIDYNLCLDQYKKECTKPCLI